MLVWFCCSVLLNTIACVSTHGRRNTLLTSHHTTAGPHMTAGVSIHGRRDASLDTHLSPTVHHISRHVLYDLRPEVLPSLEANISESRQLINSSSLLDPRHKMLASRGLAHPSTRRRRSDALTSVATDGPVLLECGVSCSCSRYNKTEYEDVFSVICNSTEGKVPKPDWVVLPLFLCNACMITSLPSFNVYV